MLEAELERISNSRLYPVSVFVLDANNLKEINDKQGHQEGDRMLKAIAEVLQKTFRTEDIISRIGGDEYAVLLPLTERAMCLEIQKRLLHNIKVNNENSSMPRIDVAIGTATTQKDELLTEVLKRADERMYAMKTAMKEKSR
jgi:diguanylate cyclase (GGDEF)-like protein